MRKSPKLVLMALATFLLPNVHGFGQAIVAVEENGHKVYVNDVAAAPDAAKAAKARTYRLVYWSQTEQRWKPVPGAVTMRAARSAAAEVEHYFGVSGLNVPKLGEPDGKAAKATDPAGKPADAAAKAVAVSAKPADAIAATPATGVHTLTSAQIEAAIEEAATRHHVDANLVRAVIKVESNFNPRAVSPKGAMGLMQLMPGTARELSVSNPFDPQQNVDAGVRHLRGLLEAYNGDVPMTLAAYNAGAKAVERNKGIPPYRETRDYVRRITALYGNGTAVKDFNVGTHISVKRGPDGVLVISNTD